MKSKITGALIAAVVAVSFLTCGSAHAKSAKADTKKDAVHESKDSCCHDKDSKKDKKSCHDKNNNCHGKDMMMDNDSCHDKGNCKSNDTCHDKNKDSCHGKDKMMNNDSCHDKDKGSCHHDKDKKKK